MASAAAAHVRRIPIGVLWGVLSALSYSMASVVGKDLLDHLRPHELLFWRFTIAAAVMWTVLPIRRRRGGPSPLDPARLRLMALGALFGYMSWLGFVALERIDASLYIVLVYIYPAFVAAAAPLLGQRVPAKVWAAIVVILLGITFTVPGLWQGKIEAATSGVVLTLVQAVVLAGYTFIASRTMRSSTDGLVSIGWSVAGSWLALTTLSLVQGMQLPDRADVVAQLAFFAIVPTIVATGSFYQALRSISATSASTIATLEPALTVIWAVIFLGERLSGLRILGTVLVLVGVVWSQRAAADPERVGS